MNSESWIVNIKFSLLEIKLWKKKFIQKQRTNNPNISNEELNKKIKNAKRNKFKNKFDFLIFDHPKNPYS